QLRQLALEHEQGAGAPAAAPAAPSAAPPAPVPAAAPAPAAASGELPVRVRINRIQEKDVESLVNEMALMGQILHRDQSGGDLSLWLQTTTPAADLEAVCCFIVNADQVSVTHEAVPGAAPAASAPAPAAEASAVPEPALAVEAPAPVQDAPEPASARETVAETAGKPGGSPKAAKPKESGTIRVGVEKVDQIINLVGELVITQAMLLQTSQTLDPVLH